MLLSATRRSYRQNSAVCVRILFDMKIDARHCNAYSGTGSKFFSKKKYTAISQRAGAHVGERILFLSAIRRSYRQNSAVCVRILVRTGTIQTPYLSVRKCYNINFIVFAVDARCGDVNSHRGTPSRGLECPGFEAASTTDPAGKRTVHFPTTLPFFKPTLRMIPIYAISDILRWREYYTSGVGSY